jgi:hypothetical protein
LEGVAANQNGIDTRDELGVSVRLAATGWQEIVLPIPARNKTVKTGSNEYR